MRRLTLALVLVLLIPTLAMSNDARVRTLAGGRSDYLPGDRSDCDNFPARSVEHSVIYMENVSPTSGSTSVANSDLRNGGFMTHIESVDATVGFHVNRRSNGYEHQLDNAGYDGKTAHVDDPASPLIGLRWATESWGFLLDFGLSSAQDDVAATSKAAEIKTFSNYFVDLTWGTTMASGMELGLTGFVSSLGNLDGDNQSKAAFGAHATVRKPMDRDFFNYLIFGGGFFRDSQFTDDDAVDPASSFRVAADLLNYHPSDNMGGGMGDLTHVLAIGLAFSSFKDEGMDVDRASTFSVPVTAGAEVPISDHFTASGSMTHTWAYTFVTDNNSSGGSGTSTAVGLGYNNGPFGLNFVVNNALLTNGPYLIGGRSNTGFSSYVSADWLLGG